MNVFLENVNLKSNSGPNYFAQKLIKYLSLRSVLFNSNFPYDLKLTFIETQNHLVNLPMIQRLDGIYFNANFDCDKMNSNIKRTYEKSKGVIFQTEFNKNLIFNWFGEHDNYRVIQNGADTVFLDDITAKKPLELKQFNNIWSCAAHWHPFKRLKENIEYFLEYSDKDDCLVVAGPNPDYLIKNPRVIYAGDLDPNNLLSLFKISNYFIHLAYLDHCPNVVVDARASGCKIICSDSGGTKEIAGPGAVLIAETHKWDYSFIEEKFPPPLNFNNKVFNLHDIDVSMKTTSKKYFNFFEDVLQEV
tara:strand:+ start:925 stop:1833 length:909 start_codon:yes stop_codon:yes gene_type:complete